MKTLNQTKLLIISALTLSLGGCGTTFITPQTTPTSGQQGSAATMTSPAQTVVAAPAPAVASPAPAAPVAATSATTNSLAEAAPIVQNVSQVVCNSTNAGTLIYVDAIGFYNCQGSAWVAVDKDASSPPDTTPVPTVIQGPQGIAGKDGANAKTLELGQWVDPVTNLEWVVGQHLAFENASSSTASLCATGARLATVAEFKSAYLNGMFLHFLEYDSTDNANDCTFIGSATSCFEIDGNIMPFSQLDLKNGGANVLCVIGQ